ncbi:hypothetical protein Avbf_16822 [Armadillidium vulgare]|nr:hypothetical protein Avbf_16822 [Armadillidium vulgare]
MEVDKDPVAWFEFMLNPSRLEEHLKLENPDPTPIDLIVQFIYNGMKRNENSAAANESELLVQPHKE